MGETELVCHAFGFKARRMESGAARTTNKTIRATFWEFDRSAHIALIVRGIKGNDVAGEHD